MSELLTRAQVVEIAKIDCQFLTYGHCETRACLVRSGYQSGPTIGFEPTCPYRQVVDTDAALRAQRQEDETLLDAIYEAADGLPQDGEKVPGGRKWLSLPQQIARIRAQLAQAMQSQEQLAANVNMGLLEIRTLKAELAQVTAERDAKSLALQRVYKIASCQACHGRGIWRDRLTENEWGPPCPCPECTEPLQHQLAEVRARVKELEHHILILSQRREMEEGA